MHMRKFGNIAHRAGVVVVVGVVIKKRSSHTKPRLRVAPPNTRKVAASF